MLTIFSANWPLFRFKIKYDKIKFLGRGTINKWKAGIFMFDSCFPLYFYKIGLLPTKTSLTAQTHFLWYNLPVAYLQWSILSPPLRYLLNFFPEAFLLLHKYKCQLDSMLTSPSSKDVNSSVIFFHSFFNCPYTSSP